MRVKAAHVALFRFGFLLSDRPGDLIERLVPQPQAGRLIDAWGEVTDRIDWLVSRRICAHDEAVPDQCGIPAHDYCRGCGKLMPGMAPRGPRRVLPPA